MKGDCYLHNRLWVLLATGFLLAACSKKAETTTPTVQDITEAVYASGEVKAKGQYQLFPKVSGTLTRVLVTEGDSVKAGQVLMEIENEAARLGTEGAQIAAEQARVGANSEKLADAQAAIKLARERLQTDSALFYRQQNLWRQGVGTKVELEQRQLAYQNSATAHRSARLRYQDLRKQLQFSERQARTNLELSKTQASYFLISSETDGRVYSLLREKGEMVSPQTPVALMGHARDFLLELQVDEFDIARIKPGQRIFLNLDSYKGQVFEARVTRINPAMNPRTRSFLVEAEFVTKPPRLYPNLTAEANIVIRTRKSALTIPREYLVSDSFVETENGGRQKVRTGLRDYQKVEILEGISKETVLVKQHR